MNKTKALLIFGCLLIALGLLKPDLSSIIPNNKPVSVDVMDLSAPKDELIKAQADEVISIMKSASDAKQDSKKLRDLYLDIAKLIELDGEDQAVKSTDDIRQANSIAGPMLRLDMKGKYVDLAKETNDVIVTAIGNDSMILTNELRSKAVEGFLALAWAFNEGGK